MTTSRN